MAVSFTVKDKETMLAEGYTVDESELGYVYYPSEGITIPDSISVNYVEYPWITCFEVAGIEIQKKKKEAPAEGYQIVFSDLDGTLLNSQQQITPMTLEAIRTLQAKNIVFVIASTREPSDIYPILDAYDLHCPVIARGGALILDENRNVLVDLEMDSSITKAAAFGILCALWNIPPASTIAFEDIQQDLEIL